MSPLSNFYRSSSIDLRFANRSSFWRCSTHSCSRLSSIAFLSSCDIKLVFYTGGSIWGPSLSNDLGYWNIYAGSVFLGCGCSGKPIPFIRESRSSSLYSRSLAFLTYFFFILANFASDLACRASLCLRWSIWAFSLMNSALPTNPL